MAGMKTPIASILAKAALFVGTGLMMLSLLSSELVLLSGAVLVAAGIIGMAILDRG
jgi:hypothetical protein